MVIVFVYSVYSIHCMTDLTTQVRYPWPILNLQFSLPPSLFHSMLSNISTPPPLIYLYKFSWFSYVCVCALFLFLSLTESISFYLTVPLSSACLAPWLSNRCNGGHLWVDDALDHHHHPTPPPTSTTTRLLQRPWNMNHRAFKFLYFSWFGMIFLLIVYLS